MSKRVVQLESTELAEHADGTEQSELDEAAKPAPHERVWPRPWMNGFLHAMSALPDVTAACKHVGISRNSAYRWRDKDPVFAEGWEEAQEMARDAMQRQARTWAVAGLERVETTTTVVERVNVKGERSTVTTTIEKRGVDRSPAMLIFMLKAWLPDRYRWAEKFEHGGIPEGAPVRVESVSEIDAKIEALAAELDMRARAAGTPVPED